MFLTSSEEFRRNAFAVHAFDYLTKPVTLERVSTVLGDALAVLPREKAYLEVVSGRKTVALLLRNIASVVTDAHYVDIGLADGVTVRVRDRLQLEQAVQDYHFTKIRARQRHGQEGRTRFEYSGMAGDSAPVSDPVSRSGVLLSACAQSDGFSPAKTAGLYLGFCFPARRPCWCARMSCSTRAPG